MYWWGRHCIIEMYIGILYSLKMVTHLLLYINHFYVMYYFISQSHNIIIKIKYCFDLRHN